MPISKTENGKWLADFQPGGRGGKRIRKTFATKGEAKEYEIWLKSKSQDPEWSPKRDKRRLNDLLTIWYSAHGKHLKSGDDTFARLKAFATDIGNPPLCATSADHFTSWRTDKIAGGMAAATTNRILAYTKSALNALIRTNVISTQNPFSKIKQIQIDEHELSFLSIAQIKSLLHTLQNDARNKHAYLVAKVCLATGARWSEGERMRISQLQGALIQFARTKSSKARAVPIDPELQAEIETHFKTHGDGQQIFGTAYNAFREGLKRAKITLPDGQCTHILRHTFASHFMQRGGNILTLQRILGHHSVTMTMRYAHLAPDHLSDAVRLNPLADIDG
ncbi:integrase [Zoogloea oleivorans]|uniref:Integrase n=1 Tax=Zoogloea oleivorans TaxID=1552750 RepID=A0A6C2D7T6_9RHOO|nr:tyrosine-type recombinase/integrase [Zoogloea oleivorans]TYC62076.1 integrase [Zoogloea oleivorans]